MAITEKTIKERERLDDRPKVPVTNPPVIESEPFISDSSNIYLFSAENIQMATMDAREKGISKDKMVYVPMAQPLRAKALMGRHGLRKDQLIGYFSDMEIQYLTS
jgi:hypothetical protein